MKQFVAPILCFSLVFTGVLLLLRKNEVPDPLPRYGRLPEVILEHSSGAAFRPSQLNGTVSLWSFFFTSCEGPCPKLQAEMLKLQRRLKRTQNVQLVSVSVDHETDTPERLRAYAEKLGARPENWSFLRAEETPLRSLAIQGFQVGVDPGNLIHSNRIALVDSTGEVRGLYDSTEEQKMEKLVEDTKRLVRESASAQGS